MCFDLQKGFHLWWLCLRGTNNGVQGDLEIGLETALRTNRLQHF